MSNTLFEELQQRGFINQSSNMDAVRDLLDNGKIVAYLGSDPTADSLHVGHFMITAGETPASPVGISC